MIGVIVSLVSIVLVRVIAVGGGVTVKSPCQCQRQRQC